MGKCPYCGTELLSTGICFNMQCDSLGYSFNDDLESQVNNNIWVADLAVSKLNLESKPVFYILGGVALHLHDLNYSYTLDIDTANKIEEKVKDVIAGMLDDAASEVAVLPRYYERRAVRVKEHLRYIEVYVLSKEDLLFTKLLTNRSKDRKAIMTSGILDQIQYSDVLEIATKELDGEIRERAITEIEYIHSQHLF